VFADEFKKSNKGLPYAYTDTTTLRNSVTVISRDNPYPECMLDLACITYMCVMYYKVVVNVPESEILLPLKDCLVPLRIEPISVGPGYC